MVREKKQMRKFATVMILLCTSALLQGCNREREGDDAIDTTIEINNMDSVQLSPTETEECEIESIECISEFTDDWCVEYKYYYDPAGNTLELEYISDYEVEISIVRDRVYCINTNEYEIEYDEIAGHKYIYKDIYSDYTQIIYYPESNHNIEVINEYATMLCVNISESEYLSAKQEYVLEQLSGFTEDWYKASEYFWSYSINDGFKIDYFEWENDAEVFCINALDFSSNEYEIDYDNYCYVYEYAGMDDSIYLSYYPNDCTIEILGGDGIELYWPVSEETYFANIEAISTEHNTASTGNDLNNNKEYTDAEIYEAARYFISEAIQDTTYSKYSWEIKNTVSVSPYIGGGYTATFYIYSSELCSYKYLRVNIGVGANGFYFISGGM